MDNHVKNKKYGNFVSISSLTGEYAAEKFKNICSSSLWTCLHHMVILRSQNKITDFLMILAWASLFNITKVPFLLLLLGLLLCPSWPGIFTKSLIFNFISPAQNMPSKVVKYQLFKVSYSAVKYTVALINHYHM